MPVPASMTVVRRRENAAATLRTIARCPSRLSPPPGQVVRDAVQQRQRAFGVDGDDVVVELHARRVIGFDVGALLVGIETVHPSTLRVRTDGIVSSKN